MKERNILGSSKGYVKRITDSYQALSIEKVRKYFLKTLNFCHFYMEGETGYTVNKKMEELRKAHRGAAEFEVDHSHKA